MVSARTAAAWAMMQRFRRCLPREFRSSKPGFPGYLDEMRGLLHLPPVELHALFIEVDRRFGGPAPLLLRSMNRLSATAGPLASKRLFAAGVSWMTGPLTDTESGLVVERCAFLEQLGPKACLHICKGVIETVSEPKWGLQTTLRPPSWVHDDGAHGGDLRCTIEMSSR